MACKSGTKCQFSNSDVEAVESVNDWICKNCSKILTHATCLKEKAVEINGHTQTANTGLNAYASDAALITALKEEPDVKDNNISSFTMKKLAEHDEKSNSLASVFLAAKSFASTTGGIGPLTLMINRLKKVSTACNKIRNNTGTSSTTQTAAKNYQDTAKSLQPAMVKLIQCSKQLQALNQEYLNLLNQEGKKAEEAVDDATPWFGSLTPAEQAELDKAKEDLAALKRLGYGSSGAAAAGALGAAVAADQQQIKRIFQEQCFLLAKIDKLAEFKSDSIEFVEARPLPYVGDGAGKTAPNAGGNTALQVAGQPWGFINRLTQDPSFGNFFEVPNHVIGQLSPMIKLKKIITDPDGKESEIEINFDSAGQNAKSILQNREKRGFGVGIKKFSFAYRGSDPFAVKKSIEAKLVIFASSFDDLLKVRGSKGSEYRYVDLALKTGANLTDKPPPASAPDSIDAMVDNLGKLEFRLKAILGWQVPQGGTPATAGVTTAIYNSFVTLNLTPTVHEFDIDEIGRVTFTCNYLAYVEDFFDQPNFNIFSDTTSNVNMFKRRLLFKYLSKQCAPADLAAAKKDEAPMIDQEKKSNLRHIMNKLLQWKKVRYIEIPFSSIRDFLQQGPAYEWNPYDSPPQLITDDAATAFQKQVLADLEAGFDPTTMWAEDAPTNMDLAEYVTYFYLSDLVDVVLHGIEKNLSALEGAIDGVEDSRITDDDKIAERIKIKRLQQHFKNFRVILGPIELYDPSDPKRFIHANLGDIPISLKYFMDWLTDKTLKRENAIYPLPKFLNDLMNNFVRNFLNSNSCFDTNIKQKIRVNQCAITGYRNKAKKGYSPFDEVTDMILNQRKIPDPTGELGWATASRLWGPEYDDSLPQPLLNVMGRRGEAESDPGLDPEVNYMTYFAGRVQPIEKMNGNYYEDKANGIFHYILGRDSGLVKNIKLVKTNAPGLKEVRFEQEGYDGLLQLREVYDANISCFGMPNAYPGTYIYVEPQSFAPATNTFSRNSSALPIDPYDLSSYGIGGYYMIIESENSLGPGEFNTEITAKWVAQLEKETKKPAKKAKKAPDEGETSSDPRCKIASS